MVVVLLVVISIILGIRLVFVQIDRDYYKSLSQINKREADALRMLFDAMKPLSGPRK